MDDPTPLGQLQPSLLDRLIDDERGGKDKPREKRVPLQPRESVRDNLAALFNSIHLAALENLEGFPETARSVLNFGIPDLAGHTLSGFDKIKIEQLEQVLCQAIRDFEPRLIRNTVQVHLVAGDQTSRQNSMHFVIEGELWGQPTPVQLYLKTQIDLEDGNVVVADVGKRD